MEYVHSELSSGRAKSINDALKEIGKVRKTVDRFRYIYYLNIVDRNSFAEVRQSHSQVLCVPLCILQLKYFAACYII